MSEIVKLVLKLIAAIVQLALWVLLTVALFHDDIRSFGLFSATLALFYLSDIRDDIRELK